MKIKTWLLLSYFIVMVLPLIAFYFLFVSVTSYYGEKQVEEYLHAYEQIQKITPFLQDESLYGANGNTEVLEPFINDQTNITLYNSDGLLIYNPKEEMYFSQSKDFLLQNLYELKQELRSFTYKEPVFINNEFIGIFEIEIKRNQLLKTIANKSLLVTITFISIFLLIYGVMAFILHRRLNKRLEQLMSEMSAFASGDVQLESATGKDEIGELKQHFYAMRKQIIAAQEVIELEQRAKEYLIATISHDLKTPLTSIKAYAESLDNDEQMTDEERQTYRKVIIEKADFIKQMLDDLTMHSLLQSHDYELELVTVEGDEFFEMLVSDYEPLSKKKQIVLHSSNSARGLYKVNPQQLIRVADNLVMNAIQHTDVGKSIWIAAFSDELHIPSWLFPFVKDVYQFDFEKYAYIVVQNEGKGIEGSAMQHIFQPLYQVDQARSKKDTRGTGLGLSITKQIIEKHGGTIDGFSKIDIGTCFICSIPKKEC